MHNKNILKRYIEFHPSDRIRPLQSLPLITAIRNPRPYMRGRNMHDHHDDDDDDVFGGVISRL